MTPKNRPQCSSEMSAFKDLDHPNLGGNIKLLNFAALWSI